MEEGVQGTTKEIGGKTDSDRVAQKMAPGNGNVREVQLLTTWKGTTPEPKLLSTEEYCSVTGSWLSFWRDFPSPRRQMA